MPDGKAGWTAAREIRINNWMISNERIHMRLITSTYMVYLQEYLIRISNYLIYALYII